MTDYAVQRTFMVDSQIRPSDVTDRRIPRAMLEIPREVFAGNRKAIAYADGHLPVGDPSLRRFLLAPRILAKMIQGLEIDEDNAVLDIGCATGYSTAILARMGRRITGVEADAGLAAQARTALAGLGVTNATITNGPLEGGAVSASPFDAILVNGAVAEMPSAILDQMKDGGRLAAILIEAGVGRVTLWRRFGTTFDRRPLFDAEAPLLAGFARKAEFVF